VHLTQLAREHGDKPAVIMGGSGATLSYAELERQSNKIAHGVPDPEMGQRVHAVVQPAVSGSGTPELAAELIDFCRSRIAHHKSPWTVFFEDELPRLPSGKMLRRLLMDRYRSREVPGGGH
jgi:acyl-coenzyme A synthetase/AMP-(fatty) acid ligase